MGINQHESTKRRMFILKFVGEAFRTLMTDYNDSIRVGSLKAQYA
jgi:hypothetical protein